MTFFGRFRRRRAVPPANRTQREAKAASQRRVAFGPLMSEAERREFEQAVAAQKARDFGVGGLFQ